MRLHESFPCSFILAKFIVRISQMQVSREKSRLSLGTQSILVAMHPDTPFDFIFIDADKLSNVHYFTEAKHLVRKGGVIVCDRPQSVLIIAQCDTTDCGQRCYPLHLSDNAEGVRALLRAIKGDLEVQPPSLLQAKRFMMDFCMLLRNDGNRIQIPLVYNYVHVDG
jgi:O-methyltransferase